MDKVLDILNNLWLSTGFYQLGAEPLQLVMIALGGLLLYMGIVKKFEPLLLVGIAFGMILTNTPGSGMYHP